jgi:hypothetical protein
MIFSIEWDWRTWSLGAGLAQHFGDNWGGLVQLMAGPLYLAVEWGG